MPVFADVAGGACKVTPCVGKAFMPVPPDEHARTMAFAEIALGQIRALGQAATPRNFEVWYTYATGYNPSLNQLINDTLASSGNLAESDIDHIYNTYLSPTRLTDRIDRVGSQVMDEMDQVMALIEAAAGSTTDYSESLADASQRLHKAETPEGLRAIVETLVNNTKKMEAANQSLEERLQASKQEINQLQENLETVRTESLTDPLTSLANRKYFDQALAKAMDDANANGEPLSLLIADIDHFKKFNDTFGHLTGDQVLRLVAMALKQNVKGQDIATRYGGEEFAVVLPHTVLRSAITVADHIRRAVMTKELIKRSTGEHLGRVTVSVGVATMRPGDSIAALIERADHCLYAAKRNGRNRVVSEIDPEIMQAEQKVA
jgi:diguanylate cyclase